MHTTARTGVSDLQFKKWLVPVTRQNTGPEPERNRDGTEPERNGTEPNRTEPERNEFKKLTPPRLPDILELREKKIAVSQENLVQYIKHSHIKNVLVYDNNVSRSPVGDFNLSEKLPEEKANKHKFVNEYGAIIHPVLRNAIISSSARFMAI